MTTKEVVEILVKPATCSPGCSFVDRVSSSGGVAFYPKLEDALLELFDPKDFGVDASVPIDIPLCGPATVFVSHAWSGGFLRLCESVEAAGEFWGRSVSAEARTGFALGVQTARSRSARLRQPCRAVTNSTVLDDNERFASVRTVFLWIDAFTVNQVQRREKETTHHSLYLPSMMLRLELADKMPFFRSTTPTP